jgi:hypothetical protein
VKDASFELRGEGKSPRTGKPAGPDFEDLHGVFAWHRKGTPFDVSLAKGEAHTGMYSVLMNECGKAVVSESAATPNGGQFHLEVWLKHTDPFALYQVQITPTGAQGKTAPTLMNVPVHPDAWQKFELEYLAPPGTHTISLQVIANGQAPGAKLWIDDYFIGRYAD